MTKDDYSPRIEKLLHQELKLFPEAQLQDVYKLFYQDFFGPGHYIPDINAVSHYLKDELDNYSRLSPFLKTQPIFCLNNFLRIDICVVDVLINKHDFLDIFVQSSRITLNQPLTWQEHWQTILKLLSKTNPHLIIEEKSVSRLNEIARQYGEVHHSEKYRELYQPHYRLISEQLWLKALNRGFPPDKR
ncbi:MAG: hypothetical protein K9N06_12505 [Candidatus Cloacimonetes bacterium]|nr:hypothetical protein [Candidatus Cloacimonadota bacterium]